MKSKLIALTIACSTMFVAVPVSASINLRQNDNYQWNYRDSINDDSIDMGQAEQEWQQYNTNKDMSNDTIFNGYTLDCNDGRVTGNLIIINMNNTTGSAVIYPIGVTTASAVTFPVGITTDAAVQIPFDITTSSAVNLSFDNAPIFKDIINESNKEEDRLNIWEKNIDEKMDEQFEKIQKQLDIPWNLIGK
jgi:hypothetical protein